MLAGLGLILINRASGLVLPLSVRFLLDDVLGRLQAELLPRIVAAVLGAALVQAVTSYTLTQLISKAGLRLVAELRVRLVAHVLRMPISFFDHRPAGDLAARIMTDVDGLRNLLGTGVLDLVGGVAAAAMALGYLLYLSPSMTLLTVGVILLFVAAVERTVSRLRSIYFLYARTYAAVTGRLTETLGGVRTVKAYGAEKGESKTFAVGAGRLLAAVFSAIKLESAMSIFSSAGLGIVGALVMYLGAHQVVSGRLTPGQYVTYAALLAFMVAPVKDLVSVGTQLANAFAGLERTLELLELSEEDAGPTPTASVESILGEVQFNDVTFEYEPGRPVLHGISFQAPPGTVTALVGSSGAGKSTILSLLCGFQAPSSGSVQVDGKDLATLPRREYRKQLGVVFQETFLFDGSIRENILFARPTATAAELAEVCRIAHVDEFAERFPQGIVTVAGERGVKLSGGQRQRISLARALLANPRILLLDEATSSLDSESEAFIQDAMSHLLEDRTTFVIAHRLSTIRRADQILVLEQGRIVEKGTHESLCEQRGRYFQLYQRQRDANLEPRTDFGAGDGDRTRNQRLGKPLLYH